MPLLPSNEGITWFVLKTPLEISAHQIEAFAKPFPHYADSAAGRVFKETLSDSAVSVQGVMRLELRNAGSSPSSFACGVGRESLARPIGFCAHRKLGRNSYASYAG